MGALQPHLEPVIAGIRARRPVRTGSLVITIMGDVVVPRGGVVWLGSIVELLEPFGISHGQVRTAVMRLRGEEWLTRESLGRRSFVGLTEQGRRRLDEATSRIYGDEPEPWSGRWTVLLFPEGLPPRHPIRTALGWLGFGTLGPQVYVHPNPDRGALQSVLDDARTQLPICGVPVEIEGLGSLLATEDTPQPALEKLVESCWTFDPLESSYQRFVDRFGPIADVLASRIEVEPWEAVVLRVALIHEYRRVLLRDPWLPPVLLPRQWVGREVRQLVSFVYRVILGPSELWLQTHLEGPNGTLEIAGPELLTRLRK